MVTIFLLRHGETMFNANGNRYCGRTDVPLTKKGIEQAERMSELLKNNTFDAVFSSTLGRAIQTAGIVSGNPEKVICDSRLVEIDFGQWEGKSAEVFQKEDPESWINWLGNPENTKAGKTGETGSQVIDRLNSFYSEIWENYQNKRVLIVGHNGVNRFFLCSKLGIPLKNYRRIIQENSSLTLLNLVNKNEIQLLKLNA